MSDQLPLPGPAKADCECGCGLFGTPRKNGHIRLCKCVRCRNGRNHKGGKRKQREFQKNAGIKQAAWRGANGHEESWRDYWRWEIKSGAQVRPAITAYLRQRLQADSNKAAGDPRPFAAGMTWNGTSVVVVAVDDWATHVVPLFNERGA